MMRNLQVKLSFSLLLSFCFLASYFSYAQQTYDKVNNGIVLHVQSDAPGSAKIVKLQVVNDNIIRVTSTTATDFSNDTSLIIVYKSNSNNQFTTEQNGDTVYLKTNSLTAKISNNNGNVSFIKNDGTPILQEKIAAEPKFTSAVFDGITLYHINQKFQTTDDDAWYGLGQHQSDVYNYRNHQVFLFQNNGSCCSISNFTQELWHFMG